MRKLFTSAFLLAATAAGAQTTNPAPYCTGAFAQNQLFISDVSVGTLNNITANSVSPTGYYYYNNVAAPTLNVGSNYTATINFNNFPTVHYVGVFIDYNQNNSFSDPGELVLNKFITNQGQPTSPATQSFTIPATATAGQTRMRVILLEDDDYTFGNGTQIQPPDPYSCVPVSGPSNYQMGQTQDYNVIIGGSSTQTPPLATTMTATGITAIAATLNGSANAMGTTANVVFEYGTTTAYGQTVAATPATISGTSDVLVSKALTGLTPNTTYHFRVKASNNAGTANGADDTFRTAATTQTPPLATTMTATGVTTIAATLNGSANAMGTTANVVFEYGTTTAYGQTVAATPATISGTSDVLVSKALTGLTPNTTYHFRVRASNNAGTDNGADDTFRTAATNQPAPIATATAATNITGTSAKFNGTVNARGASTTVVFEYGTTTAYGQTIAATPATVSGNTATAVSATPTGLLPNTTYHYRVKATNIGGPATSADQVFTTAAAAPTVVTTTATAITSVAATVSGTVKANGAAATVVFEYGTTTAYGRTATATPATVTGAATTTVSAALSGLLPNTTYHYRVKATNSMGANTGADKTFTTATPPQPAPVVIVSAATNITSNAAQLNGTVNAQGAATGVVFEYGTTPNFGQTITATPATVSGNVATAVSATPTGLQPNTTYYYRIQATNSGGVKTSSNLTFRTAAFQPAPVVTTTNATNISGNSATLNGTVIANGGATTAIFEYGLTTAYGQTANATPATINGANPTSVSAAIGGLQPYKTYNFRLRATNSGGTSNGSNRTFRTTALGVIEFDGEKSFVISPNPSNGVLRLLQNGAQPLKPVAATFYTIAGQQALQTSTDANGVIHAEVLPAGLYQLRLSDSEGRFEVHTISIQK